MLGNLTFQTLSVQRFRADEALPREVLEKCAAGDQCICPEVGCPARLSDMFQSPSHTLLRWDKPRHTAENSGSEGPAIATSCFREVEEARACASDEHNDFLLLKPHPRPPPAPGRKKQSQRCNARQPATISVADLRFLCRHSPRLWCCKGWQLHVRPHLRTKCCLSLEWVLREQLAGRLEI